MAVDLKVKIGSLVLANPVIVASGTFGSGREYEDIVDVNKLGGLITKTITLKEREGNPPPRLIETACGLINAIGLENGGLDDYLKEKIPYLEKLKVPVIASVAGFNRAEFSELTKAMDEQKAISAVELNVSCPNVDSENKLMFSQDEAALGEVVKAARQKTKKPIIVKLSPNVTDIAELAKAAEQAGADALNLVNTFSAMAVDIETRQPKLGNIKGGLSGPAVKPIALHLVYQASQAVSIAVIGGGGIMSAGDALEFIICGASAVSVGTANFIEPDIAIRISQGVKDYLEKNNIKSISGLSGSLKTGV